MCYLLVENRKDVSKGGLIHICTFVLLKLSGERLFGVAINKECTVRLPTDLPLFYGESGLQKHLRRSWFSPSRAARRDVLTSIKTQTRPHPTTVPRHVPPV